MEGLAIFCCFVSDLSTVVKVLSLKIANPKKSGLESGFQAN